MNKNFLNVNNIRDYSTLSHKQIRNNINGLKKLSHFNDLIFGGGKGKGGQFWCHYTLVHIHFTLQSSLKVPEIKELLKSYFNLINISIDDIFLTEFDTNFKDNTLNYLLRRGNHSSKSDVIDWGLSSPSFQLD